MENKVLSACDVFFFCDSNNEIPVTNCAINWQNSKNLQALNFEYNDRKLLLKDNSCSKVNLCW